MKIKSIKNNEAMVVNNLNDQSSLYTTLTEKWREIKNIINHEIHAPNGLKHSIFSTDLLFLTLSSDCKNVPPEIEDSFLENLDEVSTVTFCDGLCGVGWWLQHSINQQKLLPDAFTELLLQIDEIAYTSAINFIQQGNHDFLHGAIGNITYLIERLNWNEKVVNYLERIVSDLYETVIEKENGELFWLENNRSLAEKAHDQRKKLVNLSLSHGLAGKIVIFSKLYAHKILPQITHRLLKGSIQFLMGCKNENMQFSCFPGEIDPERKTEGRSRLAWCYGDLGIAIAFCQAAAVLKDERLKNEAIAIGLHTVARKSLEQTGFVDAGICHGTCGVAHIYLRLYEYTNRNEFKEAAEYWLQDTLKWAKFEDAVAGFRTHDPDYENGILDDFSFLNGISGIGLVLDTFLTKKADSSWDKCLLLS